MVKEIEDIFTSLNISTFFSPLGSIDKNVTYGMNETDPQPPIFYFAQCICKLR